MRVRVLFVTVTVVLSMLPAATAQAHHRLGHPAADGQVTKCGGKTLVDPALEGTDGPDILNGTEGDDVIVGWGDNDTINGFGGHDTICAGTGIDTITGGDGHDDIVGEGGGDTIDGGPGNDSMLGGSGDDTIEGGAGRDTVYHWDVPRLRPEYGVRVDLAFVEGASVGFAAIDRSDGPQHYEETDTLRRIEAVYGTSGRDELLGADQPAEGHPGAYEEYFDGDPGNDVISGRGGRDLIRGSAGDDTILGGDGNDDLGGYAGVDTIYGEAGNDRIEGLEGNDILHGGEGFDHLDYQCTTPIGNFCPAGNEDPPLLTTGQAVDLRENTSVPADETKPAEQTQGTDTISGFEGVRGSPFDDKLYGRDFQTTDGFGDTFWPMAGNDVVDGRGGEDYLEYIGVPQLPAADGEFTVDVNLAIGIAQGMHGADTIADIENVGGSDYRDRIVGDAGRNWIDARLGADVVDGGEGDDVINYGNAPSRVLVSDPDRSTVGPANVSGGFGADALSNIEDVYGSVFDDVLTGGSANNDIVGGAGHDQLSGLGGRDRLHGGSGNDRLDGGAEFDFVDYECTAGAGECGIVSAGQEVNLGATDHEGLAHGSSTGGQGDDLISNVEGVRGTHLGDTLYGRDVHTEEDPDGGLYGDYFWPGNGDDVVDGRGDADYVEYARYEDDPAEDCTGAGVGGAGLTIFLTPRENGSPEVTGYLGEDHLTDIEHATGSPRDDDMVGSGGANEMWGGCGDDVISGADGNDTLVGHDGNDVVQGEAGDDRLTGAAGDDALDGGPGAGDLISFDAVERPQGVTDGVQVHLGSGTAQGEGEDFIAATEIIIGSEYDDVLVGARGPNILIGGAGTDDLWGRDGADRLVGYGVVARKRDDGSIAVDAADRIYGGSGADTADYAKAARDPARTFTVDVNLGAGTVGTAREGDTTDTVSGIEVVQGSAFDDRLIGDANRNLLLGGSGDDKLFGGLGRDYLDGGAGADDYNGGAGALDAVDFGHGDDNAQLRVAGNQATVTDAAGGTITEDVHYVEIVVGTDGADSIDGGTAAEYFAGENGNDTLLGRGGNDFLFGGVGSDTLHGGLGTNTCFGGEIVKACAVGSDPTAASGWYDSNVFKPRDFRDNGNDEFLDNLDEILEDLRRLHRRRLHR